MTLTLMTTMPMTTLTMTIIQTNIHIETSRGTDGGVGMATVTLALTKHHSTTIKTHDSIRLVPSSP